MKRTVALLVMLMTFTLAASAQQKRDTIHAKKAEAGKVKIPQQLGLSAEQEKKWKAEKDAFKKAKEAVKDDKTLSSAQKKEKEKALSTQHRQKLTDILTPEQAAKYKTIKDEEDEKGDKKKDKGKKKS